MQLIKLLVVILQVGCCFPLVACSSSPMWPTCNTTGVASHFLVPIIGGDFNAIACTYNFLVSVVDTAGRSAPATMLLKGGTTPGGFGLQATSNTSSPIHVTIRDVIFGDNAYFHFSGSLPPSSSISITNNTFRMVFLSGMASDISVIRIGIGTETTAPLQLLASTSILVANNTVYEWKQSGLGGIIRFPRPMNLSDSSSILVVGNSLSGNTDTQYARFISFTSSDLLVTGRSLIAVHSNLIWNFTGIVAANIVRFSIPTIGIEQGSTILFDNNKANGFQNFLGDSDAALIVVDIYIFSLTLTNGSVFSISGNQIRSSFVRLSASNFLVRLQPYSSRQYLNLTITSNSKLIISGNAITNFTSNGAIEGVCWSISTSSLSLQVANGSSLLFDNNSIIGSSSAAVRVVSVIFGYGYPSTYVRQISITNSSIVSISMNAMRNCTLVSTSAYVASAVVLLGLADTLTLNVSSGSRLSIGHNQVVDSNSANSQSSCVYIYSAATRVAAVSIFNRSLLSISSNSVAGSTFTSTIYIKIPSSSSSSVSVLVSGQSQLAFDNNQLNGSIPNSYSLQAVAVASEVTLALQLTDGSSLSLSRNVVKDATSPVVFAVYLIANGFTINLAGSEIVLSNNSIGQSSVSGRAQCVLIEATGLYWPYPAALTISMANRSKFAIEGNAITTLVGTLKVVQVASLTSSGPNMIIKISASNGSSIIIRGNSISNVSASVNASMFQLLTLNSLGLTFAVNSGFFVEANAISSTTAAGSLQVLGIQAGTLLTIQSSTQSFLTVARNSISAISLTSQISNVTMVSIVGVAETSSVTVAHLSALEANMNAITCGVSNPTGVAFVTMIYINCPLDLQSSSSLSLGWSDVAVRSPSNSSVTSLLALKKLTLRQSNATIDSNSIQASSSFVNILNISGPLTLLDSYELFIERNALTAGSLKILSSAFNSNATLGSISACGNTRTGTLIANPAMYIVPSTLADTVEPCPTVTAGLTPSGVGTVTQSRSDMPPKTNSDKIGHSSSGITPGTQSHKGSASVSMPASASRTSMSSISPSQLIVGSHSDSISMVSDTCSASNFVTRSVSIEATPKSLTLSSSPSLPVPESNPFSAVIPLPVPPPLTMGISVAASAVGGTVAAADAQTIALIGLVSCARNDDDGKMRALSVVALDDTCEGVLLGNVILIGAATALSVVTVAFASLVVQKRERALLPIAVLHKACALTRCPQLFLSVCVYFMNSSAVCGLKLARGSTHQAAGSIAFIFPLLIVLAFPILTVLFGSRRLLPVKYTWKPAIASRLGSAVFQFVALDESVDAYKLFGCVIGGYRWLGCQWTLVAHISFVSGLPMMLATEASGTCGPLFVVSSVLYLLGAVLIFTTWPRRVTLTDIFHGLSLLLNGLVVANAAALVLDPEASTDSASRSALDNMGTAITVITVLRIGHSVSMALLRLLIRLGHVTGVEVSCPTADISKDEFDLLLEPSEMTLTGTEKELFQPDSPFLPWLTMKTMEYSGILWPLLRTVRTVPKEGATGGLSDALLDVFLGAVVDNAGPLAHHPAPDDIQLEDISSLNTPYVSLPSHGLRLPVNEVEEEYDLDLFLTDDERFRREVARDCVRRELEAMRSNRK